MPERQVYINLSKEIRDEIKAQKRELTYEQFLVYLLEKTKGKTPSAKSSTTLQSRRTS